jgi:MFS family permease
VLIALLSASFLFNLGQGVLRPSLPLYLQRVFAARYQQVTLIPAVFGAGKWIASLPTGYLLDTLGRRLLMTSGLLLIAGSDLGSVIVSRYGAFLALRALAGVGWAMFATVATTAMVGGRAVSRRGRAVSLLLMSETLGLLLGSSVGGLLYQRVGTVTPFVFEAACMLAASLVLIGATFPAAEPRSTSGGGSRNWRRLGTALRVPGVLLMGLTSAALTVVQTGILVFLFPLYLVERAGLSPSTMGLLVSLGVLGRLGALWVGGGTSDRVGRMRVLIPGLLLYSVLLGSLTLLTHPVALGLWSLAIGGAGGLVAPLPAALIGDRAPLAVQGVAIGWLRTITDTGQIVGPLIMGAVADTLDLTAPFFLGATLLLVTAWQCRRHARAMSMSTAS